MFHVYLFNLNFIFFIHRKLEILTQQSLVSYVVSSMLSSVLIAYQTFVDYLIEAIMVGV